MEDRYVARVKGFDLVKEKSNNYLDLMKILIYVMLAIHLNCYGMPKEDVEAWISSDNPLLGEWKIIETEGFSEGSMKFIYDHSNIEKNGKLSSNRFEKIGWFSIGAGQFLWKAEAENEIEIADPEVEKMAILKYVLKDEKMTMTYLQGGPKKVKMVFRKVED